MRKMREDKMNWDEMDCYDSHKNCDIHKDCNSNDKYWVDNDDDISVQLVIINIIILYYTMCLLQFNSIQFNSIQFNSI
jgi:hypothetical protein